MVCINVNEVQVEGIKGIRDSVYNDFQSQFKLVKTAQPDLENFNFNTLADQDVEMLVA